MNTYKIILSSGKVLEIDADWFRIDEESKRIIFHGKGIDNSELHFPSENTTIINKSMWDEKIKEG
jgi:preprotein translocase subunit SecA